MRFRVIQRILGVLLMGFCLTMLPPVLVSFIYADGQAIHFIYSFALTLGLGIICWLPVRNAKEVLRVRDGFIVVGLFWIVLSALSAVPFIFAPHVGLVDALFESVSGFTTTGATVIIGLDALPKSILYYRQQLQWFGGMGIVVLAIAIIPMLGVGGMQLFRAETPGPMKDDKLMPRIKSVAGHLYLLYVGFTLLCTIAYRLAGMPWFDALGHAFSTISTGGFSTHDASIGYFDNPAIEMVATIFMLVGAINFAVHFRAIIGGQWRLYWRDEEVRAFFLVVLAVSLILTALLASESTYNGIGHAIRAVSFQVISITTSTGFTTANYADWPYFAPVTLIFISFIGGCAGSTAGGMKVIRWLLMGKQGFREVSLLAHPRAMIAIKVNRQVLPERVITAVWGFFTLYMLTFGLLMLLMMWTGLDQVTAFSAVATCMNNLGPGLGDVTNNFAEVNHASIGIAIAAMLLGRLEIFTLLVLVSPVFWKN